MKKIAIVTGSSGLIGSQSVKFLIDKGYIVYGIDNDMRSYFFGKEATTKPSERKLKSDFGDNFIPNDADIRSMFDLRKIFLEASNAGDLDMIVHTAAQPSHDWAAKEPLTDFSINATGTVNLLECTREFVPEATFVFTSTNKVYGDRPNLSYDNDLSEDDYGLRIIESETRYDGFFIDPIVGDRPASIDEKMSIDFCKHSVFGASKVAADVMVQEYGRYFDMNTVVFRGGCLTGPNHAGAELHGFLAYLIKCIVNDEPYTIFGFKGKQVRDNIHSWDLVNMFWNYHQNPRPGEVYNAGGGRDNSTSILEAIDKVNKILGREIPWDKFTVTDDRRSGDHIWYISDLSKFKEHYPDWDITISLDETIKQMVEFELSLIPQKV